MTHHLSPSKIIALSALGVLCCANLGYASWTYASGDATAEGLVQVTVGTFTYIKKPGWYTYDGTSKNSYVFNNDLGFIIRGATYKENSDGQLVLSAFPSDASKGLVIDSLINYESCPVVFLPKQISLYDASGIATETYDVVSYDPECGLKRNDRGTESLFFDLTQNSSTYYTVPDSDDGGKYKTLRVNSGWIKVYPYDTTTGTSSTTLSTTDLKVYTNGDALEYLSFYEPETTSNTTLQYIGTRAFGYMDKIASVDLSGCNNLVWVDEWAFNTCPALTSFVLPTAYRAINNKIGSVCKSLTTKVASTYFDDSRGNLHGCLQLCTALTSFDFSIYPNITNLPRVMFRDDYSLTSITLSTALITNDRVTSNNNTKGDATFGAYFYDMGASQSSVIKASPFNDLAAKGKLAKLSLVYQGTTAQWSTLATVLNNKWYLRYRTLDTVTSGTVTKAGSFTGYVSCKGTPDSTTSDGYAHVSVSINN